MKVKSMLDFLLKFVIPGFIAFILLINIQSGFSNEHHLENAFLISGLLFSAWCVLVIFFSLKRPKK